jgi:hypothetical protein
MNDDKEQAAEVLLVPLGDDSRQYQAFHGKTTDTQEMILLIPAEGAFDTYLPIANIRLTDIAKNGLQIVLATSTAIIRISGKNLRNGAHAIANRRCGRVEAYDPQRRDKPADPLAPFVESIKFYDPPGHRTLDHQEEQPAQRRPIKPIIK